ncbi:hypothetical protein LCL87_20340 [Rhodococcus hoagii]|nr:hypothetical protein [Prescottella equi]
MSWPGSRQVRFPTLRPRLGVHRSATVFTGAGLVTASTAARDQAMAGAGVFVVP